MPAFTLDTEDPFEPLPGIYLADARLKTVHVEDGSSGKTHVAAKIVQPGQPVTLTGARAGNVLSPPMVVGRNLVEGSAFRVGDTWWVGRTSGAANGIMLVDGAKSYTSAVLGTCPMIASTPTEALFAIGAKSLMRIRLGGREFYLAHTPRAVQTFNLDEANAAVAFLAYGKETAQQVLTRLRETNRTPTEVQLALERQVNRR